MRSPDPFRYPDKPHARRHGPQGYAHYSQYRDWLRDEFRFRCVFCLVREQWTQCKSLFDIDHWEPRALKPNLENDYDNLLYSCRTCNSDKSSSLIPDPCKCDYGKSLEIQNDGTIHALNADGEILIDELDLDAPSRNQFRKLLILTVQLVTKHDDKELLVLYLGFPENLPDLKRKHPSGNSRGSGLHDSWSAKKSRGDLPEIIE
jgi:HNH endonuclease